MPKSILVVDDDTTTQELLVYQLNTNGYVASAVGSGEEALAAVAAKRPDVVLLDINLPGIDGWETLRRLRSGTATAALPVILLTTRSEAEDVFHGYEAGAVYYVPKPYLLDELLRGLKLVESGR